MTKCPVQSKRQRLQLSYLTSGDANHRGKLGYRAGCIHRSSPCEQPMKIESPASSGRSGGGKGLVKDSACVVVFGQGPAAGLLDFARASRGYLDAPA